jgi:hypothetical protein
MVVPIFAIQFKPFSIKSMLLGALGMSFNNTSKVVLRPQQIFLVGGE